MGYEPRGAMGGGSSESREGVEGNRETREREERGRGGDNRDTSPTEQRQSQPADEPANPAVDRSLFGRLKDLFGFDDEEGDQMTDAEGNVVAEAFTIDEPAKIETINLGQKTDYEAVDQPNPYESYARTVMDSGLVGDEQEEKDLARDIADAGRAAQAADIAGTFGGALAGPIGAAPSMAYDAFTSFDDDPVEQAGRSLYEGGKVDAPGASTAIGAAFGGAASTAFDVANDVFGGSSQLGEFERAAGIDRSPQPSDPRDREFGRGEDRGTTASLTSAPTTMAGTFSMPSFDNTLYSDFLTNFFKQG